MKAAQFVEAVLKQIPTATVTVIATSIVGLFAAILWRFGRPLLATLEQTADKKQLMDIAAALLILLTLSLLRSWLLVRQLTPRYGFDPVYGCRTDLKKAHRLCPKCEHPMVDMGKGTMLLCQKCAHTVLPYGS